MNAREAAESEPAKTESRGERRRARILSALHDCVIRQGYSKTSLRDVAQAADMSASHLLYYFSGKDAILELYFEGVAQLLLDRMENFRSKRPAEQVDLLADLFFAGKGITRSEIGFMLECFGVAVHDRVLRQHKTRLDRLSKAYLTDLFESLSDRREQSAQDAAEIAYAILIGLRTAAYFEKNMDLSQARRLFREAIISLAESDGLTAGTPVSSDRAKDSKQPGP